MFGISATFAICLISFISLACSPSVGGQESNIHHPVFMATDFQFDQVDELCVMPIAGSATPDQHRLALMWKLQDKGYRVADPNCYRDIDGLNEAQRKKSRWMLKVSLKDIKDVNPNIKTKAVIDANKIPESNPLGNGDGATKEVDMRVITDESYVVVGEEMTASLFDNNLSKEVWRDTIKLGFFGRVEYNIQNINDQIENNFGRNLATFEKKKKLSPPSIESEWAPISFAVIFGRPWYADFCNGLLKLDSGTLSFEPSSNGSHDSKCASFQFSVPGAKVKPGSRLDIPGKGRYEIEHGSPIEILTLYVALRNLR